MNLPYTLTVRLWDYVFCEGYRAIFFVAISLLQELEGRPYPATPSKHLTHSLVESSAEELLQLEMEGIFLLLGSELSYRQLDPDRVIKGAVKLRRRAKKNNYALFRHIEEQYSRSDPLAA